MMGVEGEYSMVLVLTCISQCSLELQWNHWPSARTLNIFTQFLHSIYLVAGLMFFAVQGNP
jgi:hypothetical protein